MPLTGFTYFKSLMKEREAVGDAWLAIINGEGKQTLKLFLMEVQQMMIRLVVIC
jgi:hypothetical protein